VGIDPNQDDFIIIMIEITNWIENKVFDNQGNLTNILLWPTIFMLKIPYKKMMFCIKSLVGFVGGRVNIRGYINLIIIPKYY